MIPLKKVALVILLFATGCNYPGSPQAPTVDLVSTAVAGTLAAEAAALQASATATQMVELLRPVYFLSERSGSTQVWRLEADGVNQWQVTDEAFPVDGYDGGSMSMLTVQVG